MTRRLGTNKLKARRVNDCYSAPQTFSDAELRDSSLQANLALYGETVDVSYSFYRLDCRTDCEVDDCVSVGRDVRLFSHFVDMRGDITDSIKHVTLMLF